MYYLNKNFENGGDDSQVNADVFIKDLKQISENWNNSHNAVRHIADKILRHLLNKKKGKRIDVQEDDEFSLFFKDADEFDNVIGIFIDEDDDKIWIDTESKYYDLDDLVSDWDLQYLVFRFLQISGYDVAIPKYLSHNADKDEDDTDKDEDSKSTPTDTDSSENTLDSFYKKLKGL